jgi:hypothetical protein
MAKLTLTEYLMIGIKNKQYPQFVYKYRDPKDKFFEDIFKNKQMFFSSPKIFNDPFDCQLDTNPSSSRDDIVSFLKRALPSATQDEIQFYLDTATNNPNKFREILVDAVKFDKRGILCLSQSPDNIVLWSHYANYHEGVCLKFDMSKNPDFFLTPLYVEYTKDYPAYNHLTSTDNQILKMITTKYIDWSYEKELRIYKREFGPVDFKKEALVEIIFGLKTPVDEIDRIKEMMNKYGFTHLKYSKADRIHGEFKLAINELK